MSLLWQIKNIRKVRDSHSLEYPEMKVLHNERYLEVALDTEGVGVGSNKNSDLSICKHTLYGYTGEKSDHKLEIATLCSFMVNRKKRKIMYAYLLEHPDVNMVYNERYPEVVVDTENTKKRDKNTVEKNAGTLTYYC